MPAVSTALVIGSGASGCAAAVLLAQAGVAVDLVEARPAPSTTGSGITLQGNALRVLRSLGVWPQVRASGYAFDSLGIRLPDPSATLVAELPDVHTGGPDLPGTVGMSRPELAAVLVARAREVGVALHWSTAPVALEPDDDGVDVQLAGPEGTTGKRYDVVVGADGIHSWTRRAIGVDTEPRPVGMGIWRVHAARPVDVVRTDLVYGGRCHIAGYCPTSEDSLYAYLVEDAQDRSGLSREEQLAVFRDLASSYHGPWDAIRAGLTDETPVNYARFETHLVDGPWNRGRVVLVGDAAHSCPPTIAQGAALALEDAAVLAELLTTREAADDALWAAYTERRLERVRTVVDSSVQIARWMLDHTPREEADVAGVAGRVFALVTAPA